MDHLINGILSFLSPWQTHLPHRDLDRASSKRIDPLQNLTWLDSLLVIRIDKGIAHLSTRIDQQRRWNRQRKRIIPIARLEVIAELGKRLPQRIWLGPHNPKLRGVLVPNVRQDGELERVLLHGRQRAVGQLGGDGDKRDTLGFELGDAFLQCTQREVAERAPFAAVEGHDDRTFGEEVGAADFLAEGVGELERGEAVAYLDGGFGVEGCDEVVGGFEDDFADGFGGVVLEVVGDIVELGLEGSHGDEADDAKLPSMGGQGKIRSSAGSNG